MKILKANIIYPVADSRWVSAIHLVPKKGGITVEEGRNGEKIAKRKTTGWRMCIDYRKLKRMTRRSLKSSLLT